MTGPAAQLAFDAAGGALWRPGPAVSFGVDARVARAHHAVMDGADRQDIQACLGGDGEAYARLVRRHQGGLAARMRRFTRDAHALEELVQQVFVEAYFGLEGFRGEAPFAHWLNRIATRVGYRFWKRRRRRQAEGGLALADWDGGAAATADPREAAELLDGLLSRLRPRDRLVLTLMHLEGRSVAETADLTGWSRTMVKVQAHRARNRLRVVAKELGLPVGGPAREEMP